MTTEGRIKIAQIIFGHLARKDGATPDEIQDEMRRSVQPKEIIGVFGLQTVASRLQEMAEAGDLEKTAEGRFKTASPGAHRY